MSGMTTPSEASVLILLASHNGERYIGAQLESVLAQTRADWRLMIRDDSSSDGTLGEIERFLHDPRIELVRSSNRSGAKENFAELMRLACASHEPYIMLCDQDDVWREDKIERLLGEMHQLEQALGTSTPLLIHSDLEVVDAELNCLNPSFHRYQGLRHEDDAPLRVLLAQNFVTGCATLFNRPLLELAVPLPPETLMHDWWLALLAAAAGRIGFVSAPLVRYRQHGRNHVGASSIRDKIRRPGDLKGQLGKSAANYRHSIAQARTLLERLSERAARLPRQEAIRISDYSDLATIAKPLGRFRQVRSNGIAPQSAVRRVLFYWRTLTA